jgi:hypothetical protein
MNKQGQENFLINLAQLQELDDEDEFTIKHKEKFSWLIYIGCGSFVIYTLEEILREVAMKWFAVVK